MKSGLLALLTTASRNPKPTKLDNLKATSKQSESKRTQQPCCNNFRPASDPIIQQRSEQEAVCVRQKMLTNSRTFQKSAKE